MTCQLLQGTQRGAFLHVTGPGGECTVTLWPASTTPDEDMQRLGLRAIDTGRCLLSDAVSENTAGATATSVIALPLVGTGLPDAAIVVRIPAATPDVCRRFARQLNHCAAWLPLLAAAPATTATSPERPVLDCLAPALEHRKLHTAATAVATQLATQLGCERVSIGFLHKQHVRVVAISRHGSFDERTALSRGIATAMDEALDQDAAVICPAPDGERFRVTQAHAELCRQPGINAAGTVPLSDAGELIGAITLEHADPARFDAATVALCIAIAGFVGPILGARRREERGVVAHLRDYAGDVGERVFGPRHVALKLLLAAALLVVCAGTFLSAGHVVTADAVLRGTIQRLVVTPTDGFIAEAPVRAGDIVAEGDLLATLDDRILQLEQLKWSSERERLLNEYREAMAALDSTKVSILRAQVDRATAELQLTTERLGWTRIVAPLDGVVVSGDLTQAIGAPVKQGDTLFEIAPLDGYRVMLQVDERDVGEVALGQSGRLALSGFPGDYLPFTVDRITPVSEARDGRNFFVVEARLQQAPPLLRPGMQGVGKLDVGDRQLGWIWTHRLVDWLQLRTWAWFG